MWLDLGLPVMIDPLPELAHSGISPSENPWNFGGAPLRRSLLMCLTW